MIGMIFAFEYDKQTNRYIFGKDMTLPWGHVPKDMEIFKEYTSCKGEYTNDPVLVMGRDTFESIKDKGIKNRKFWVLSTTKNYDEYLNTTTFSNDDVLEEEIKKYEGNVYIIGGSTILERYLDVVDNISLSYFINKNTSHGNVFLNKEFIKKMFIDFNIKEKTLHKDFDKAFIHMKLEPKNGKIRRITERTDESEDNS